MESIITFLLLLTVAAIASWLKNRAAGQNTDDSENAPPNAPPSEQRPRPRMTSWEEEMRRLLEGESGLPPVRPRTPPVVVVRPPPVIAANPPPAPVVKPVIKPVIVPRAPRPPMVPPLPSPVPIFMEPAPAQMGQLRESQKAYERASQIDKTMSAHIDQVQGHKVGTTIVTRRPVAAEVVQAAAMFKSPMAARQAVMVSIVLGPPRSLDESPVAGWF